MTPTLQELKTLNQRTALRSLLREAAEYPDSVLTAIGYLLWTVAQENEKARSGGQDKET